MMDDSVDAFFTYNRPVGVCRSAGGGKCDRDADALLLEQGSAILGLVLYVELGEPLAPYDGVDAFLSGLLLGLVLEGNRCSR